MLQESLQIINMKIVTTKQEGEAVLSLCISEMDITIIYTFRIFKQNYLCSFVFYVHRMKCLYVDSEKYFQKHPWQFWAQ